LPPSVSRVLNIVHRVVGFLNRPQAEWAAVAREDPEPAAVYATYVVILAAVPALAILTGLAVAAGRYLGTAGILTAINAALVGYGISLAVVALAGIGIGLVAPRFKSSGGIREAVALVAYAS